MGLLDKRGAQVRHLSGGQARRFSVVAALVNDADVVFYTFSDERRGKRGRGTRLPLVRRR